MAPHSLRTFCVLCASFASFAVRSFYFSGGSVIGGFGSLFGRINSLFGPLREFALDLLQQQWLAHPEQALRAAWKGVFPVSSR
jgi:hypothetical protein